MEEMIQSDLKGSGVYYLTNASLVKFDNTTK